MYVEKSNKAVGDAPGACVSLAFHIWIWFEHLIFLLP